MEEAIETVTETNRDRVRRILIAPLGFRRSAKVAEADHAAALDGVADELAYLGDADLAVLFEMLKTKGEGAARNVWPDRATVRGFAEVVRPRPLDQMPALRRWFASVEGPRALAEGTLVATWRYFERRKAPPVLPGARAAVAAEAADDARRLLILREKQARGIPVTGDDLGWAAAHQALHARLVAMIEELREGRA